MSCCYPCTIPWNNWTRNGKVTYFVYPWHDLDIMPDERRHKKWTATTPNNKFFLKVPFYVLPQFLITRVYYVASAISRRDLKTDITHSSLIPTLCTSWTCICGNLASELPLNIRFRSVSCVMLRSGAFWKRCCLKSVWMCSFSRSGGRFDFR